MFELADEAALPTPLIDLRVVVAGAEVAVAGFGSHSRCQNDRQDAVADGDDRASFASPADQMPVVIAEEGVGAGETGDDLADGPAQPRVAFAGGTAFLAGGLRVDGGELGP